MLKSFVALWCSRGKYHVSVLDVGSSLCNDFFLISGKDRLVGPVKIEVDVIIFGLGLGGVCQ